MLFMRRRIFAVVVSSALLGGCASSGFSMSSWLSDSSQQPDAPTVTMVPERPESGIRYRAEMRELLPASQATDTQPNTAYFNTPKTLYSPQFTHKGLTDYAQQLAMKLVQNGPKLNSTLTVGVASFVAFDQSLSQTSVLGNQLAEVLMGEVQQFGLSVVDFKITDGISVGSQGDLVFSRSAARLAQNQAIEYILSGTLISNEKGVNVNARIVSLQNKQVISSASILIPHFMVRDLQPDYAIATE